METIENINKYTISRHAMERYSERIMGKEENIDINRFITLNEDKIKTDINKMITHGELIYSGKQYKSKDGKNANAVVDVFLRDCWIVLADNKSKNVITLYKIDLNLGDDFNKIYISKMMEKLTEAKVSLEETKQQVEEESNTYKRLITEAEFQIKEYKAMIKNLEELCVGYKIIVDNNIVKVSHANRELAEVVNQMIGKKEF